ncbi:H/ACA ribonucleoprotein complex non-core subunit NAF1 [Thalictrum thalictroides]|uniref:H/ACA ribonucleoprotein complex non-core subunit NAF1 n=1 Tax=Thalictrum thalictroides TaxID=46969 RepID=A0A7J6WSI6_THATH|nr:H/ACA ribonucleoprotein complex non-core subunit NAF1 [Thalictrum thalictroides]
MVGFDTTIKNNHQASKLSNQIDLTEHSILELPELSLELLEPLSDFDFIDDWIIDNNSVNISMEDNQVVNDSVDEFVGLAMPDVSLESDDNLEEEKFCKKIGSGFLIEEEMGKVNLVGASESLNFADQDQESHGCLSELKVKENAVEGNEVPVVVDNVTSTVPVCHDRYEGSGELQLRENINEVNDNPSFVKVEYDCLTELKSEENGDREHVVGLVKEVDNTIQNCAKSREMASDVEDSSSTSESETESDSSSSSSSSSNEEEEDEEKEMDKAVEVEEGEIKEFDPEEILIGSDEDEVSIKGPIKSKNEIEFLPPVPPVDVTLEPHHQTLPVGVVLSIMDAKVVVQGVEKHNPLNEGSILWITETRSPLGLVDEIFGPVKNPFYIVRYNSDQEVPAGICHGTPVSFVSDFAEHVINDKNLYKKGYDVSGENDEEISEEIEFSDDEREAEYRRAKKMAHKGANDRKHGNREPVAWKKVQNKRSWKDTELSAHTGQTKSSNQLHMPPVSAEQASASVPPSAPPASHVNLFTPQHLMPSNGMTGQSQQHMVFPNGFPMNGMPFQHLNPYQQPAQMLNGFPSGMPFQQQLGGMPFQQLSGMPFQQQFSGMPFQQQFAPSPMLMPNVSLPYGQPNFSPRPSTSSPGNLGHPGFNQAQFGMDLHGHHGQTPVHTGDQQGMSNGSYDNQSNEMPPPSNMQGNNTAHHQHNQGRNSTRGRRPYRRGGHFSGRRGHQ